jgi:hypothetical protein
MVGCQLKGRSPLIAKKGRPTVGAALLVYIQTFHFLLICNRDRYRTFTAGDYSCAP